MNNISVREYKWYPANLGKRSKCLECNRRCDYSQFVTEEIRMGDHKKLYVKLCPDCDFKFCYNNVFGKKIWRDFKLFIGNR